MVAQLREQLAPVIWPNRPETERGHPGGFLRGADGLLVLTPSGAEQAAIAQRIVLRYAIQLESLDDLASRYGYSNRQIRQIAIGRSWSHLTRPVRFRLTALGLGNLRARHTAAGRERFKAVMQALAGRAAEIMRDPSQSHSQEAQTAATDLFLLSGAWREDERP